MFISFYLLVLQPNAKVFGSHQREVLVAFQHRRIVTFDLEFHHAVQLIQVILFCIPILRLLKN